MRDENKLVLTGRLIEVGSLKFTPAGVAILHFRMAHESTQSEAGSLRDVNLEISAVAVEGEARLLAAAKLGMNIVASGFMDRKSRLSNQTLLHITHIEFVNQD